MKTERFNIVDHFFEAADQYPENIAIRYKSEKVTFSELQKMVADTATYFQQEGIKKGDRILVFVPVSIHLYRIVLALFNLGATAVFLDEWVSFKRLEACCAVADCKGFIGISKARILGLFSAGVRAIPIKLGVNYKKVNHQLSQSHTTADDTALITFTTGSTGTPKAANRSHGFLNEQFNVLKEKINPTPADTDMPAFPVVLLLNLGIGAQSVIPDFNSHKPETLNPETVFKQLSNFKASRIEASPFFIRRLADFILEKKLRLPHLKFIFTGGAPVFPAEANIFTTAFPEAEIVVVYGATEAEPISTIAASELAEESSATLVKGLKVGTPYYKSKVRIILIQEGNISCNTQHDLIKLEMPEGEIGEIIVSGPHVLDSYFNNEEAFKRNKISVEGVTWHRTGDSGYVKNGVLFLTGRCNTLIHQNQQVIATFMIENFIQSRPQVSVGTVLELEKKLYAVVELKDGINNNDLPDELQKLGLTLSGTIILKKIPRDQRHNSKIDYIKLRELVADRQLK